MAGSLAYLSRPVDFPWGGDPHLSPGFRSTVVKAFLDLCSERQIIVYRPASAFGGTLPGPPRGIVQDINERVLECCDMVFVIVDGTFSVGTFRELQIAVTHGIPVGVCAPQSVIDRSWALANLSMVSSDVDEVFNYLCEQVDGTADQREGGV